MKRWQESMTPGAQHKMLEESVGTWDAEVKMWMNGPKGEPMVQREQAKAKWSLGKIPSTGFHRGDDGTALRGNGIHRLRQFKKKYVSFWIDNMSTGMSTMDGVLDKDGKSVTMWGK